MSSHNDFLWLVRRSLNSLVVEYLANGDEGVGRIKDFGCRLSDFSGR